MIAQRLRPIGWVASASGAALCFYLVSLQVAAERAALESVEHRIASTRHDIRRLETEFGARASLRQLEAYNGEVLALTAPTAKQYVNNPMQLAAYLGERPEPKVGDVPGATALASAQSDAPAKPTLKPAVVTDTKRQDAPVVPAAGHTAPLIQTVAMIETVPPKIADRKDVGPARSGLQKVAMLDDGTLGDIRRTAAKEAKARKQ